MPIRIDEGVMRLEIDGRIVATATEWAGGWWEVTYWPRFFDRNQAITALTVTELLETGRDSNDPVVSGPPSGATQPARWSGPPSRVAVARYPGGSGPDRPGRSRLAGRTSGRWASQ